MASSAAASRVRSHPYAVLCFLLFRVGAVVAYLLCLFISDNFVLNFVFVAPPDARARSGIGVEFSL